jgi:hypothetical protein
LYKAHQFSVAKPILRNDNITDSFSLPLYNDENRRDVGIVLYNEEGFDVEIDFFVNCDRKQVKAYKIFTDYRKPEGQVNSVVSDYTCGEIMKVFAV